jgi:hypothetical protein
MRILFLTLFIFCASMQVSAQFAFELKVDNAMRVGNTDEYAVNGTIVTGRLEKGKIYFLEDGTKVEIKNMISSKTATSVPVANSNENVSLALTCKDFVPTHGDMMRGITTRPSMNGNITKYNANQMAEGLLSCRLNGKIYHAKLVSKPVYIRSSNILDMFFIAQDESVIWLQVNGFSEIEEVPHQLKSDTSQKNMSLVCKLAFLPKGYRPTDMPTDYKAFEDMKGNSGIVITQLNKYKKTIGFDFSGILRPNKKLLELNENAGLFYITEGRVDNVSWDEFK